VSPPVAKTHRSMGKATQCYGENRLSYSLKVSRQSNISVSSHSSTEYVLFAAKEARPVVVAGSAAPPAPCAATGAETVTGTDLGSSPPQPASHNWTAALTAQVVRLLSLLFTAVRARPLVYAMRFPES
jgi:hypothetical protein